MKRFFLSVLMIAQSWAGVIVVVDSHVTQDAIKQKGKGIFCSNYETSPHASMVKVAMLTGRHALDSGVFGEMGTWKFSQNSTILSSLLDNGWKIDALGWWGLGHTKGKLPENFGFPVCSSDEQVVKTMESEELISTWALWPDANHSAFLKYLGQKSNFSHGILSAKDLSARVRSLGEKEFLWISGDREGLEKNELEKFLTGIEIDSLKNHQIIVSGKNFVWLAGKGFESCQESRAVSPQDLLVSWAKLAELNWNPQVNVSSGRDIMKKTEWDVQVSHVGEMLSTLSFGQMKYRGARVLTPNGVLKNGTEWIGAQKEKNPILEWNPRFDAWWRGVEKNCRAGNYILLENGVSFFPEDWEKSLVDPSAPRFWMAKNWNRFQVLGAIQEGKAGSDLAGSILVEVREDRHYEFELELLPSSLWNDVIFGKFSRLGEGIAVIQSGNIRAKCQIFPGANKVKLGIDLKKGFQTLDIWFLGQRAGLARLTPFFIRMVSKSETKTPVIEFPRNTKS